MACGARVVPPCIRTAGATVMRAGVLRNAEMLSGTRNGWNVQHVNHFGQVRCPKLHVTHLRPWASKRDDLVRLHAANQCMGECESRERLVTAITSRRPEKTHAEEKLAQKRPSTPLVDTMRPFSNRELALCMDDGGVLAPQQPTTIMKYDDTR
eukprot:6403864-Amphidinium_carterae.1